jgi:hypothetical protein
MESGSKSTYSVRDLLPLLFVVLNKVKRDLGVSLARSFLGDSGEYIAEVNCTGESYSMDRNPEVIAALGVKLARPGVSAYISDTT